MLRAVAVVAWLAFVTRVLAIALPGSRSGIEALIRRADVSSSLSAQLTVLLGSAELVLLVVASLGTRSTSPFYRIVLVPTAAAILMLVMLASSMGLDPIANVALGLSCVALTLAGATVAVRVPASRAQGLVLAAVAVAGASRLAARLIAASEATRDGTTALHVAWLAALALAFDAVAVALAAARFVAERRGAGTSALVAVFVLATVVAWGALRGSLDGAPLWQVVASRSLTEMTSGPVALGGLGSRYSLEVTAVLLGGVIACWPGRISGGALCAALAVLARPGVDVPVCALVLAIAALSAPLHVSVAPREGAVPDASREKLGGVGASQARADG
jgi:hypothetical protein